MQLSKSNYMNYLRHPAWLWIEKHDKGKIPSHDENTQAIFANGAKFEHVAEAAFDGATRMHWDTNDYDSYATLGPRTTEAIERGSTTILQAKFETEDLACICDVVEIVDGQTVNLYEIKSSTAVKQEHLYDLAFQTEVLHHNGYKIRNAYVIHVNNGFVSPGFIDDVDMTVRENVTTRVLALGETTRHNIDAALRTMRQSSMPDPSPRHAKLGSLSEWLKIYRNINQLPEYSIYDLAKLTPLQIAQFEDAGIQKIVDIPTGTYLTPKQELQVLATKQDEPIINDSAIRAFLRELEFPIYFLDYETFSGVIPYFDGQRPYQQIPFQYSLHILDRPDGELRQVEYLHRDNSDPVTPLSESLRDAIGDYGSIITWNMSFEKNCNKLMGDLHSEYWDFYQMVNDRIVDLGTPFKDDMYVDKAFHGSWSIKNVMPVLIPELSYKELGIQNGGAAQYRWTQAVLEESRDDKDEIFADLRKYCELDTLAMVEIFKVLWDQFTPTNNSICCPYCGSGNIARVLWGLYDEDVLESPDIVSGRVVLGGCEIDDDISWRCNSCGKWY